MATLKRNKNGDIEFPKVNIDWQEIRKWQGTYIFQSWKEEIKHFAPFINIFSSSDYTEQHPTFTENGVVEYNLFKAPDNLPFDDYINYQAYLKHLTISHFNDLFDFKSVRKGYIFEFDIHKIILPQALFEEIENFITENNLSAIKDLVFYLIAKIQKVYIEEIAFYETEEMQHQVNNIHKEVEKVIDVIEKATKMDFVLLYQRPATH